MSITMIYYLLLIINYLFLLYMIDIEKENREILELRKKTVEEGGLLFKAKPIQTKDVYKTKASVMQPLTQPKSPLLQTKNRGMMKRQNAIL